MDSHNLSAENATLRARFKLAFAAASILLIIVFLLAISIVRGQAPPVVLVPLQITEEMEIGPTSASDNYLTAYATQLCYTYFNAQPAIFENRKRAILKLVHPRRYAAMKAQIEQDEKRLREFRTRTAFAVNSVEVEERGRQPIVKVTGLLSTLIGAKARDDKLIVVRLTFRRDGRGVLLLHALEETEAG